MVSRIEISTYRGYGNVIGYKNMIHEEICTYEVAMLAKAKGFPQDPDKNDHCLMYCWDGLRNIHPLAIWIVWEMEEYDHENLYAAPTQSLLQRWLREEKAIAIVLQPYYYNIQRSIYTWIYEIWADNNLEKTSKSPKTYELALEDALKYALENLI